MCKKILLQLSLVLQLIQHEHNFVYEVVINLFMKTLDLVFFPVKFWYHLLVVRCLLQTRGWPE